MPQSNPAGQVIVSAMLRIINQRGTPFDVLYIVLGRPVQYHVVFVVTHMALRGYTEFMGRGPTLLRHENGLRLLCMASWPGRRMVHPPVRRFNIPRLGVGVFVQIWVGEGGNQTNQRQQGGGLKKKLEHGDLFQGVSRNVVKTSTP